MGTPNHSKDDGYPKVDVSIAFQIGSSPNYFQLGLNGFHRSPCVGIASYKATLKMKYFHLWVDHTNRK